jgi:hypothetical protein
MTPAQAAQPDASRPSAGPGGRKRAARADVPSGASGLWRTATAPGATGPPGYAEGFRLPADQVPSLSARREPAVRDG